MNLTKQFERLVIHKKEGAGRKNEETDTLAFFSSLVTTEATPKPTTTTKKTTTKKSTAKKTTTKKASATHKSKRSHDE